MGISLSENQLNMLNPKSNECVIPRCEYSVVSDYTSDGVVIAYGLVLDTNRKIFIGGGLQNWVEEYDGVVLDTCTVGYLFKLLRQQNSLAYDMLFNPGNSVVHQGRIASMLLKARSDLVDRALIQRFYNKFKVSLGNCEKTAKEYLRAYRLSYALWRFSETGEWVSDIDSDDTYRELEAAVAERIPLGYYEIDEMKSRVADAMESPFITMLPTRVSGDYMDAFQIKVMKEIVKLNG